VDSTELFIRTTVVWVGSVAMLIC